MKTWKRYVRNGRGAAAVEAALGIVVLVSSSALMFEVYTSASTQATGLHAAVAVADYVSRDESPHQTEIEALTKVVHGESFAHAAAAFVVFAAEGVEQQSDQAPKPPTILWSTQVNVGPDADTDLAACSKFTGTSATALPLALSPGEVAVVAEVCIKQAGAVTYAHHILPARPDTAPVLQTT